MQDAHNHLQDRRFDGIRKEVVATMGDAGITRCVINGTSPDDWPHVARLADQYPDMVVPSFGLHPWHQPTERWTEQLIEYIDTVPNACIGECGLDRWIKGFDIELQTKVFCAQLKIATERNLPLSIHCLKAWGQLIDILESHPTPERGFLLHSYNGSAELVPRLSALGAYFSFSGYFLRADKQKTRDTFQQVPSSRLLFESDAPDMLPPGPFIGYPLPDQVNHPANLCRIVREAATFLDTKEVADNFTRFFGVECPK